MRTLEAEYATGGGAGRRYLPAAAVGELEARARIGARARAHVPLVGDRYLFREGEGQGPTARRRSAVIGHAHIQLEGCTARIRRRRRTGDTAARTAARGRAAA